LSIFVTKASPSAMKGTASSTDCVSTGAWKNKQKLWPNPAQSPLKNP
jgi:hypothetical protein